MTLKSITKKKYRKYIIILLLVFIASAAVGAYLGNALIHNKDTDQYKDKLLVTNDKSIIMIMGVDKRKDDVGRSDTLMISTVDPTNNQTYLLSIPRDTRVKIDGYGFDKINAAYAYGGRKLTQATVEELLNTKIDHYIIVNIEGFTKIIDAIGGIDINVEKRMYYHDPYDDNGGLLIDLKPGMQHMDGRTAITYVRYRDEEGDIGRIRRQQKFMKAVMDKLLSPSIIPRIPSIISAVSDSIETDMSIPEMLSFFATVKSAKDNGLKTAMVPGKPMYIGGISYWVPDIKDTRQMMAHFLGIDNFSPYINDSIEEDSSEYEQSIPEEAVEISADEHIKQQLEEDKREFSNAAKEIEDTPSRQDEADDSTTSDKPSSKASSDTKKQATIPSKDGDDATPPAPTDEPGR